MYKRQKHDIVVTQSKRNDDAQVSFYETMDKTLPYTEQMVLFAEFICRNIAQDKGLDAERAIYTAELNTLNPVSYTHLLTVEQSINYNCFTVV